MMDKNTLNATELQSATWQKLKKELYRELNTLREKNDKNLDAAETAHVRGQIQAIRNLLKIEEEAPRFKPTSSA